jgi:hypothetical protein
MIKCDHPALRYGNKGDAVRFRRKRLDAEWRVGLIHSIWCAHEDDVLISVQLLDGRASVFPAFGDEIESKEWKTNAETMTKLKAEIVKTVAGYCDDEIPPEKLEHIAYQLERVRVLSDVTVAMMLSDLMLAPMPEGEPK